MRYAEIERSPPLDKTIETPPLRKRCFVFWSVFAGSASGFRYATLPVGLIEIAGFLGSLEYARKPESGFGNRA